MCKFSVMLTNMLDTKTKIAERIRIIAAEKRITQQGVADILGLDRRSVGPRINGRIPFTAAEVYELAVAFDRDVADLFPPVVALEKAA